jgi:hypothetical protein
LESACVLVLQVGVCAIAKLADGRWRNHVSLFILSPLTASDKARWGINCKRAARWAKQRRKKLTLRDNAQQESWRKI